MAYEKSKETKEKLIYAAKKAFYKNGFDKTTMRMIAKNANVPQSLAYYYFDGKHAIAHHILDEYFYRVSRLFNRYYNSETDYFMYLLLLLRLVYREIGQNLKELDFYYKGYEKVCCDPKFDKHVFLCAKRMGLDVTEKKAHMVSIMSNAAWSELVVFKRKGLIDIKDTEIRDNVDLMRWSYLGLDQEFILDKIKEAYKLLEDIPVMNVPLLEDPDNTFEEAYKPVYDNTEVQLALKIKSYT